MTSFIKFWLLIAILLLLSPVLEANETSNWEKLREEAMVIFSEAKYKEGIDVAKRALIIAEQECDDLNIAVSLGLLALCYRYDKQYDLAEPLIKREILLKEEMYGLNHPGVAVGLDNLSALYEAQNKYSQSIPLSERALTIWEEKYKSDHYLVEAGLMNLVKLYRKVDREDEAVLLEARLKLVE
jgi:tetratricopeptide (TPR) repeat protein